jgi:hypothetical protein
VKAYGRSIAAELLADGIEAILGNPPAGLEFREIEVEDERIYVAVMRA